MKKITHFFNCSNRIKTSFSVVVFLLVAIVTQAQIELTNQYDLPGYPSVEAYYPFEKNANDYSGNNNHLAIVNALPVTGRNFGDSAAYDFNGSNTALIDSGGYDWMQNNQFAMSMWVNTSNIADTSVLLKQLYPGNDIWFGLKNGRFTFSKFSGSSTQEWVSTDSISQNAWYMLSANIKGAAPDTVEFFINGVKSSFTQESRTDYFTPSISLQHVYGAADSAGTSGFTGLIDEVKIFSYALDSARMIDMYNHEVSNWRDITFKVDMSYQIGIGTFDTGKDFIDVAGTFNEWAGGTPMTDLGGGYYSYTHSSQNINDSLEFKFRINGDWGTSEFPGGANRSWVVEDRINNLLYLYNDEEHYDNLAIVSVNQPTALSYGTADSVSVSIKNLGYNFIGGVNLSFEFDGGLPFTSFIEASLNFGDSYTHTFDTTIDVSAQGIHVLKVYLNSTDEVSLDDTLYYNITNLAVDSVYPYYQNFETAGHGWYTGGKNSSWERGTPAKSIINSAHSGSNAFVTSLTNTVAPGEESYLISPRFQGPFTNTAIEFSYFCHSNWQAGAGIQYSIDGGISWMRVADNWMVPNGTEDDVLALSWSNDMAGFIGFNNNWKTVRYDLGDIYGASEVIFRVVFGSENVLNEAFDGFAFDDFKFYEKFNTDLSIVSAKTEDNMNTNLDEYVSVSVLNFGNLEIYNWHLEAHLDNAEVFTNDFIGYSIFPGDMVNEGLVINLTNIADGPYNVTIIAYADNDENASNDTLVISGVKRPTITAFPFTDNFEGPSLYWNIYNYDGEDEKVLAIGTPGANYITGAYSGSNALASNIIDEGGFRNTIGVNSPWFDLTGMFRPTLGFAIFRELTPESGAALGIQYRTKQYDWQQLGAIDSTWYTSYLDESNDIYYKGQYYGWANSVDSAWMIVSNSFPDLANTGEIQFRFLYSVGDNWNGADGFAIDSFSVSDNPFSDDLALIKIESPSTGLAQANDSVRVLIQNQGANPATGFDISFFYDTVYLTETVLDNILPGAFYEHTFTQTINMSIEGEYWVDAEVNYVADVNSSNNMLSKGITILPLLSTPPYAFDFESGPQGWITGSLGISSMASFQHGMPMGQTINSGAGGSGYAFVTSPYGYYYADELSYVQSPFFDLTTFSAPKISLDIWSVINDYDDGAAIQYTIDNGANWVTIGGNGSGVGWYNWTSNPSQGGLPKLDILEYWTQFNGGWQYAEHSIPELAGQPEVSFRVVFGSDSDYDYNEGFAFDNFSIQESVIGLTEDFNDDTLTNWEFYAPYYLNEIGQELEVTATNKAQYDAFIYNVNLSIADNPYLAVRLKSASDVNVRFCYIDGNGNWTDWNNNGFQIPGDTTYHDYYWDFTNNLKNWQQIPVDANNIKQVAIQVNQNDTSLTSALFYMDDLRLGADAALTDNIKLFWTQVGNGCHDTPTPVEFRMVNTGIYPASNFTVSYSVNGVLMATDTITTTCNPGDTIIHVFNQLVDLTAGGPDYIQYYLFETNVNYVNDQNPSDNYQSFNYAVYNNSYVEKTGWSSYNACDGLADNNVWAIDQDSNGDIWMTGVNGVTRFDSTAFTQYRVEDGLVDNFSKSVQVASDGTVWFPASSGGFTSYKNGVFTKHFDLGTLLFDECSFEDTAGNMWFGSSNGNGIAKYDGGWTQYYEAGGVIKDIDQAPNGDMLFASNGIVMSYNGASFTEFSVDTAAYYVNEIFRDSYNTTWFYGSGRLKRYDGTGFADFSADVAGIGYIQAIEEDANGNIWFGGDYGAAMFDNTNWTIIYSGDGLIPSRVWSIVGAADGAVWFGTQNGVSVYNPNAQNLAGSYSSKIYYERIGVVIVDSVDYRKELVAINNNTYSTYLGVWPNYPMFLTINGDNSIAVATDTNVFTYPLHNIDWGNSFYNPDTKQIQLYYGYTVDGSGERKFNELMTIITDNLSVTWNQVIAGCNPGSSIPVSINIQNTGLNPIGNFDISFSLDSTLLTTETYADIIYPGENVLYNYLLSADFSTSAYSQNFIISANISPSSDDFSADNHAEFNYLAFGDYIDQPGWKSINSCNNGLGDNVVWAIDQDINDDIWLSGYNGVTRFDGTNFTQYHVEDGLADNLVWSLQAASDGTVWFLSTKGGFTQWNGSGFVTHYPFVDTLVFEECSFEDTAGNMWFGSYSGNGIAMRKKSDGLWYQYLNAGGIIEDIDLAPNGDILFANQGSVMSYNGSTFSPFVFDSVVRPDSYVSEIYRDKNGITWFFGNGILTSYNGSTFTDYSSEVASIGNIQAIEGDVNGKVWFGGDFGVTSFDGSNWVTLYHDSGIIPSKVWSILGANDGAVWFGTQIGVSQFMSGPSILVQYDMNYMISSGLFDPATDHVDVAGTFNGWAGTILNDENVDNIYEAVIYGFSIGDTIEYKARFNGDWCQKHEFQFLQNRQFVVETDNDTLFHIFNDDINPITRTLDLSVNMNKEYYLGNFDPLTDTLYFETSANCEPFNLMDDSDGDLIYRLHADSGYFTTGVMIPYNFVINQSVYEPLGSRFIEMTDTTYFDVSNVWNDDVNPIADFISYPNNLTVEFFNNSFALTDTAAFFWSFGNGKSSTAFNPIHTYNNPGEYQVCLQVTDQKGNPSEFCQLIEVLGDTTISSCLAKFDFVVSTDTIFLTNNSSENITNFFWDFGDNTFSNEKNPTHVYLNGGYYDVSLTTYDSITACLNSIVKQVIIEKGEPICYADFVYQNDFLTVNFSSNVEGNPDTYYWAFGDGNYSIEMNPLHTYKHDGFYDVCLTIYNDSTNCFDEACKLVEVQSDTIANCFADFNYVIDGGNVDFVSNSFGNITNHFWNFDDGVTDTITNPSHAYTNSGYYDVSLTIFDSVSNCLSTTSKFIFIIVPEDTSATCQAKFGYVVNGNSVVFNNNSSLNNGVYFWDFGDGSYSEKKNPTHTYNKANYYQVCLSVYDTVSECFDELCKIIPITNINTPTCNASYSYFVNGLDVNFNGLALGSVTDYFWDFGDGAYGFDSVMLHSYTKSGYYEVNFTIFNDVNNCVDEYSSVIFVYDSTANSCNAKFTSFTNLKKVTFTDKSEGNITDYFWAFGDGSYSTEDSPVHNYSKSGFYEVELTIYSSSNNCIDTYYKVVKVIDTTETYCQAGYSYYTNNKTVTFTDESSGNITDYFWDLGDGTYSTDSVVSHTYTEPGYYEVIQTVYNSTTECLDEYFNVIVVIDPTVALCKAKYNYYPTGLTVSFTSQATGAFKQHFWDFNDGSNSNKANPVHTFEKPGYYEVAYSVIDTAPNSNCFDTRYKVIFVEGTGGGSTSVELKPKFSNITTPNTFSVKFKDESLGDVSAWYWDFGNNTPAVVSQNPVNVYDTNDYYRVCLTISNTDNQETKCKFIAVGDVTNSSTAFFNYYADSVTSTAHFKNKSLGNILFYHWDFGDTYTSTQKDPSHSYADTGYYAVCLTTESATGVIKTYCKDVNIGNTIENPCLFSCVWPGDANNDTEANHYDIMTIGLNYGMEGPKREDASLSWYGQFAQNWSTYQIDGTNNKHGDCNGDGVINSADTLAITENFAFSHTYQPDAKIKNPQWLISCIWDSIIDEKAAGSRRSAKAQLSPPAKKKSGELYAIAYEIEVIGGEKLIWKTSTVSFANSWIGEDGISMLTVAQMDTNQHIIYIGSTRIDQQNVTGVGEIATLDFEFKSGIDPTGVSFNVTTLGGIVSTGEAVTVDGSIELMLQSPIEICKGDVAILDAGEGFYTYTWSTGATDTSRIEVSTAGYYVVTVTDSTGTIASDTIEVIVNELPVVDLGDDVFQDDSYTIDAGAGFASYDWSTGSTESSITVTETGNYWVVVTNDNGCSGSDTVTITITGIYDNISKNIAVYPNPNNGKFWLVYEFNSTTHPVVEIINVTGETVWRNEKMDQVGQKNLIEIDNLNKGVYYVRVIEGEKISTLRFVVL